MAVTERGALTCWPSVAPRPGRGKSWVLAMLAPKRGLRVAPVPPRAADLTRSKPGARGMPGRDEGIGPLNEPRNHQKPAAPPCCQDHPSLTVAHPIVGETEHASHTEIRTLPAEPLAASDAAFQHRHHAIRPDRGFCPPQFAALAAGGFCPLFSPLRHRRNFRLLHSRPHASSFLPPFPPTGFPGRLAVRLGCGTMKALTPGRLTPAPRSLRLHRLALPTFHPQPRELSAGRFAVVSAPTVASRLRHP